MEKQKLYEIKLFVVTIQTLSILLIVFIHLDLILKGMLLFGYVMLFRQERWHRHLVIMLVMISLLFTVTYIYK